jgi:hypothetical protein
VLLTLHGLVLVLKLEGALPQFPRLHIQLLLVVELHLLVVLEELEYTFLGGLLGWILLDQCGLLVRTLRLLDFRDHDLELLLFDAY